MSANLEKVKNFWESTPLWKGESGFAPGTAEFFEEHRDVTIRDCFAGKLDERIFPRFDKRRSVLDLGCGPGFWLIELARRGCRSLMGADLTNTALELSKKRCEIFGVSASFSRQNAENLTFVDGVFSHVNCQGVIHHTPDTQACVREIARVLEPKGTASISVYFRGFPLRAWPYVSPVGKVLTKLGGGLKGRGRESIFLNSDIEQIVRLYDGAENPIGKCYTRPEFEKMLTPYFDIDEMFLHFFPLRALPIHVPRPLHQLLDKTLGLMIYANVTKR